MKLAHIASLLSILALSGAFPVRSWAQEEGIKNVFRTSDEGVAKMKMQLQASMMGSATKGAPYAAEEVTSTNQVLADGTRIHHENRVAVYRDGEGRVRRESSPDQITIMDPVAAVSYFLNPKTMTAQKAPVLFGYRVVQPGGEGVPGLRRVESTVTLTTTRDGATSMVINGTPLDPKAMAEALDKAKRDGASVAFHDISPAGDRVFVETVAAGNLEKLAAEKLAAEKAAASIAGSAEAKSKDRAQTEDLGKQVIQGVSAEGTRTTTTIETGAIGNDRPIQIVTERWYSPELQTVLRTKTTDPRMGEHTFELMNLRRGEPGAYLFQVPAGYTLTDRKL